MRFIPLILFSLLAVTACAQHFVHYRAVVSGGALEGKEKAAASAFRPSDSDLTLSLVGDVLDLRIRAVYDQEQFSAILLPTGLTVVSFSVENAGEGTAKSAPAGHGHLHVPDFPVRLDTGDPWADDARYELEKQLWIVTHPELYDAMLGTAGAYPGSANE